MSDHRPLRLPSTAWLHAQAQAGFGRDLSWVGEAPASGDFVQQGDAASVKLRASRHTRRLPPAVRASLEAHRARGGAPTAHDGLNLVMALAEWFIHTRGAVVDWQTPAPWVLRHFVESHGVGPLVHANHASILRAFSLFLPEWYPQRGRYRGIERLIEVTYALVCEDHDHEQEALQHDTARREQTEASLADLQAKLAEARVAEAKVRAAEAEDASLGDALRAARDDTGAAEAALKAQEAVASLVWTRHEQRKARVRQLAALVRRCREIEAVLPMRLQRHGETDSDGPAAPTIEQMLACEVAAVHPSRWWAARLDPAVARRVPPGLVIHRNALLLHDPEHTTTPPMPKRRSDLLLSWQEGRPTPVELLRLTPPWTVIRPCLYPLPAAAPPRAETEEAPMSVAPEAQAVTVFHPRNGSRLDLESLEAIADMPGRVWHALRSLFPDSQGAAPTGGAMVLSGLCINGNPSQHGPPGSVEVQGVEELALSTGTALVPLPEQSGAGRSALVRVGRPLPVPVPEGFDSLDEDRAVAATVVVRMVLDQHCAPPDAAPPEGARLGGWEAARREYAPRLVCHALDEDGVNKLLKERPGRRGLVLAVRMPRRRRWMTDLASLWRPEDRRTRRLIDALEQIERKVWVAVPKGLRWHQGVLGSDWLRYQTAASAALQAAVMALETRVLSTGERVRLLTSLQRRLGERVEEAADNTETLFGPAHPFNPYRTSTQVPES